MKRSELKNLIKEVVEEVGKTNEIFGLGKSDGSDYLEYSKFLKRVRQEVPEWTQIALDAGEDEVNVLLKKAYIIAKKM